MVEIKGGSDFLKHKYPELLKSKSVSSALRSSDVKKDTGAGIQQYLNRLTRLVLDPNNRQKQTELGDLNKAQRPKAVGMLRQALIREYITNNTEKLAQGAAAVEQRVARTLGHGDLEYDQEQLQERAIIAKKDLVSSLDNWLTYLSDPKEDYPDWFKYYTFRSILQLSQYDKDKQEFPNRSKGTTKLFPDLDRGALGYVKDRIQASFDKETLTIIKEQEQKAGTPFGELLSQKTAESFATLSFAKQYAEAISKSGSITPELRAITEGEWKKYPKGSDPIHLWSSLQSKGTAWCTAGYGTATTQLQGGDFYVYYTKDTLGNPTIPRIAIRMDGDRTIGEVRGVADTAQNLEGNMAPILDTKLIEFGDEGIKFQKKSADMKQLTAIENKLKQDPATPLTKEELRFLYEVDSKIEGFGYGEDPRIKEIRENRNKKVDLCVALDCSPYQIVDKASDITTQTVAYLGDLAQKDAHVLNTRTTPLIIFGYTNFENCTTFTSLPQGTIFNGSANFEGCSSLVIIPKDVVFNGPTNFHNCTALASVSEGIVFREHVSFDDCTSLASISKGTVFNGSANFFNCTSLVSLPEGVSFNGGVDFRECVSLAKLPQGIIFNSDVDFGGCSALATIPEGAVFRSDVDFLYCTSLASIPESTVFSGDARFVHCTSLTAIPKGSLFKKSAYFKNCTSLATISEDVVFHSYADFTNCTFLAAISQSTVFYGSANFSGCNLTQELKDQLIIMKQQGKIKGEFF